MKKIFTICFIISLFFSCSSTKLLQYEGTIYTLNDIQLRVKVNTNAQKFPKTAYQTTVPYWFSFSLTNLSNSNLFEGNRLIGGSNQIASLYIAFKLNDNTLIEHKQPLIGVKVSPQMTTMEQSINVWIPKDKNIISVEGVRIEYSDTL